MGKLISGTVDSFSTDTLAGRMDEAFVQIWNSRKHDTALPTDTEAVNDRRMLFVAVAQGMLTYLHAHRSDLGTTEEQAGSIVNSEHEHQLSFDWTKTEGGS